MLSEEERQASREENRRRTREAVEALHSSAGWQAWIGARRHFHRYSLANQALIGAQMPGATRVAGYRAWLKLGYAVRKGEQAIRVRLPMPPSRKQLVTGCRPAPRRTTQPRLRDTARRERSIEPPRQTRNRCETVARRGVAIRRRSSWDALGKVRASHRTNSPGPDPQRR